MKLIKIILIGLMLIGCKSQPRTIEIEKVVTDTVFVTDTIYTHTVDTIRLQTSKCLENEIRLMNIKHYVDITEKNSKNREFFFGWIRRAISE